MDSNEIRALLAELSERLAKELIPQVYSVATWHRRIQGRAPFALSVVQEGIVIWPHRTGD